MKILILIALIYATQVQASNEKKYKPLPARAPNMSATQILNWDQFKTLPVEKKIEYFNVLRNFLNKQENKWAGRKISSLFFPVADAEDISCPDYDKASPEVQHKLDLIGGKACIKAGYLVCVTLSGACSSSDTDYMSKAKLICTGADVGKLPCRPPLFLKEDGSTLCVDKKLSQKNKSVTQTCISAQKALMSDDEYKKLVNKFLTDNPAKFKSEYDELTNTIRKGYCAPANGKKWSYDPQDCADLKIQLDKIAPVSIDTPVAPNANVPSHFSCQGNYKIPGEKEPIFIGLMMSDGTPSSYTMSASFKSGWTLTECNSSGRAIKTDVSGNPTLDASSKDENYKTCYARIDNGQKETVHFEGDSPNGRNSCKLHFSRNQDGKTGNGSKCSVGPIDGYNLQVKNDDSGVFSLIGDNSQGSLVKGTDKGPTYYELPLTAGRPVDDIFYSPATRDNDSKPDCWGRSQDIISAERSTPAAPPKNTSGVSHPPNGGRVDSIH